MSKGGGKGRNKSEAATLESIQMPPPAPKVKQESNDDSKGSAPAYDMPMSLQSLQAGLSSSIEAPNFENFDIELDQVVGGEGLGNLGENLFDYDDVDSDINLTSLQMDPFLLRDKKDMAGEDYAGFGMMPGDFSTNNLGEVDAYAALSGGMGGSGGGRSGGVNGRKSTGKAGGAKSGSSGTKGKGRKKSVKGGGGGGGGGGEGNKQQTKARRKKQPKAPKPSLMEEDGTTPNWDERLKKSLKPRAERKPPVGGKWTEEEDARLKQIVETNGAKNWKGIAELLGTLRNDVQCLHRWNKVLKPGLHKGPWTEEEDNIVKYMVMEHGVGMVSFIYKKSQRI